MIQYATVIFIQGSDDYAEFEKVAYPEREGISLGFPDTEAAHAYLMQWENGEATQDEVFNECRTEYPFCSRGDYEETVETETHVSVWNAKRGNAGLWRKIITG